MNKHRIVGLIVLIALSVIIVQFLLGYQKGPHHLQEYRSPPVAPLAEKMTTSENAPAIQSTETLLEENFNTAPDVVPAVAAWVVQIASLTNENSAQNLLKKTKEAGYDAFILSLSVEGTPTYRVCAGPFTDQSLAINALSTIQESLKITGILKQYIPGDIKDTHSQLE